MGIHALQVAAAMGAHVIALTSSASKIDMLHKYGAQDVVVTTDDPHTQISDLTHGRGVDVVLDNVGLPHVFDTAFKALGKRGRYVLTGQLDRQKISFYPVFAFFKEAVITGSASTSTASFLRSLELLECGLVQAVTAEYALGEAVLAHRAVGESTVVGRAVLVP
ncbi:zinc-binding dehydrogenase family oxidoreductase [Rhodococcus ruber BKS 20-38]|uniref:alcohol dehydrogenase n=1 Tax=Rhodococcus ruber BKS 20-38 TaxID=1278076 RepID=M2YNE4_9NOCA|nr:zinc-binding dehydrogenase family oxidoreductase [Rhodococcus ruber BKS 20-38]